MYVFCIVFTPYPWRLQGFSQFCCYTLPVLNFYPIKYDRIWILLILSFLQIQVLNGKHSFWNSHLSTDIYHQQHKWLTTIISVENIKELWNLNLECNMNQNFDPHQYELKFKILRLTINTNTQIKPTNSNFSTNKSYVNVRHCCVQGGFVLKKHIKLKSIWDKIP